MAKNMESTMTLETVKHSGGMFRVGDAEAYLARLNLSFPAYPLGQAAGAYARDERQRTVPRCSNDVRLTEKRAAHENLEQGRR